MRYAPDASHVLRSQDHVAAHPDQFEIAGDRACELIEQLVQHLGCYHILGAVLAASSDLLFDPLATTGWTMRVDTSGAGASGDLRAFLWYPGRSRTHCRVDRPICY